MVVPINAVDLPLQASPVVLVESVEHGILGPRPALLGKGPRVVGEFLHRPVTFLTGCINIAAPTDQRILGVIVGEARPDLALAIHKQLREVEPTRSHFGQITHHDSVAIGLPAALEPFASTESYAFTRIGRINNGMLTSRIERTEDNRFRQIISPGSNPDLKGIAGLLSERANALHSAAHGRKGF